MSGEEEAAPKRTPKAGPGRRRDYTGRGGRPRLHENRESGAQDKPTGKGKEKTKSRGEATPTRQEARYSGTAKGPKRGRA